MTHDDVMKVPKGKNGFWGGGDGGAVCNFVPLAVPLTVHYVSISQSLSKHTF